MFFYELFIYLLTFLLINVPIYITIEKRIMRHAALYKRGIFAVMYWAAAYYAYELAPFIGVLALISLVHRKEELAYTGLRDLDVWTFNAASLLPVAGLSVLFKLLISIVNEGYRLILVNLLAIDPKPQEIVNEFMQGELLYKVILFLLAVILAPVVEEYVFRYFIYDKLLLPRMPAFSAAVISAGLFTLLHYNVAGVPTFFGLGLFCAYIYERYGFYGAVTAHGISNLVTAILLI